MTETRRLLVVDDDAAIREMLDLVLASEGYEVTTAADGASALKSMDRVRPDLILLDMKMPVMDGWQFLEQYRRRPGPRAPVVVVTAARDDRQLAADVGADGYVAKPFAIDDLLRVLDQCMGPLHGASQGSASQAAYDR